MVGKKNPSCAICTITAANVVIKFNHLEPEPAVEAGHARRAEGLAASGDVEVDASKPGNRDGLDRQHRCRTFGRPQPVRAGGERPFFKVATSPDKR